MVDVFPTTLASSPPASSAPSTDVNESGAPAGVKQSEAPAVLPLRVVPRRAQLHGVQRIGLGGDRASKCNRIRRHIGDPVHTLISMPTLAVLALIGTCYAVLLFGFVPIYWALADRCGMELFSVGDAYYFSLITLSTIGYGTADNDFNDCWEVGPIITIQWLLGTFVNAVMLAGVYVRVSRSTRRANTVVFSRQAVLRRIDGNYFFVFQVVDIARYVLTEAHLRCYTVTSAVGDDGEEWAQHSAMRVEQPDDERGSTLFLELPTQVVHRLDAWSPLVPPRDDDSVHDPRTSYTFPEVLQRVSDNASGNRSVAMCEVCGETYETPLALLLHQISSRIDERISGHDVATSNLATGETFTSREMRRRSQASDLFDDGDSSRAGTPRRRTSLVSKPPSDGASSPRASFGSTTGAPPTSCEPQLALPALPVAQEAHSCFNHVLCTTVLDAVRGLQEKGDRAAARINALNEARADEVALPPPLETARSLLSTLIESDAPLPPALDELLAQRTRDIDAIEAWLGRSGAEVVVVVEGIEPVTGCTVAARYSYSWAHGDIVLDHGFAPCVRRATRTARPNSVANGAGFGAKPACTIDLNLFHKIVPDPVGNATCSHT